MTSTKFSDFSFDPFQSRPLSAFRETYQFCFSTNLDNSAYRLRECDSDNGVRVGVKLLRTSFMDWFMGGLKSNFIPKTPSSVTAQDVAALRSSPASMDDRQIHDLVNCVAYFAYVNRVVAGLGVLPGGREGTPGQ